MQELFQWIYRRFSSWYGSKSYRRSDFAPVGKEVLGRILNVTGEPVDEAGPVNAKKFYPIHRKAPAFDQLSTSAEILETGIKVIDLMAPGAKGGKIGLFGGAGVGKQLSSWSLLTILLNSTVVFQYSLV